MTQEIQLKSIRRMLIIFMVCLFLSGLTAIPVELQLNAALDILPKETNLYQFLLQILNGYAETATQYPFALWI